MGKPQRALLIIGALALAAVAQGAAAASPPGLLYTRNVQGTVAVWELGADGSDGHLLVAAAAQPSWAPDGARFAFVHELSSDQSGGTDIATALSDGSDVHVLTTSGRDGSPTWSPDGTRLAFARADAPPVSQIAFSIWSIDTDGTAETQLSHPPAGSYDLGPVWSPDGRTIAFTRTTFAAPPAHPDVAVVAIDVASGAERRLTPVGTDGAWPAWSPDGSRIAFISGRDHDGRTFGEDETTPNGEVYVMEADGSSPTRITHTRGDEQRVGWSERGDRLVYSSAPASSGFGPYELVIARLDGSCPTALTHGRAWHLNPAIPRTDAVEALPLSCTRPNTQSAFISRLSGAGDRVHGGSRAEAALARGLLGGLGRDTTVRSMTISSPSAARRAPAGSAWLRLVVRGRGTRNAADAVRPTWEATTLADRYAALAVAHGARPLLGLTIHYAGSGRTVSMAQAARHEWVGDERTNEVLSADAIERTLRATTLPKGVRLVSVRFARLAGIAVPEIVISTAAQSAAGRLFTLGDLVLGQLQLDQGVYLELQGRCGVLLGALGYGDLGTRGRVGTLGAGRC